jgi:two-component system, NtrC family, sensor kinase
VVANIMNPASQRGADAGDRLIDLAHLSSAVAHNLINAFSAAVSNAESIRSPVSATPDAKELAAVGTSIIDTALNASHVARKLIDWARHAIAVELQQPVGEPPPVDLNLLIGEVVESEKAASGPGINWVVSPGVISPIPGDPRQLRMMLLRFLQNAREALPGECGSIELFTHTDERNWVIVTIRDSGCGMSEEVQRRATEPFFSTKPDHAGVGLTIAQVIWRRHRGTLSIESQSGLGTTVRLSILPPARVVESSARPTA